MKIILFMLLPISSSISNFSQFKVIDFEGNSPVENAPLVVRRNQSLNGGRLLPVWGPEYEVKFDLRVNSWIRSDFG